MMETIVSMIAMNSNGTMGGHRPVISAVVTQVAIPIRATANNRTGQVDNMSLEKGEESTWRVLTTHQNIKKDHFNKQNIRKDHRRTSKRKIYRGRQQPDHTRKKLLKINDNRRWGQENQARSEKYHTL